LLRVPRGKICRLSFCSMTPADALSRIGVVQITEATDRLRVDERRRGEVLGREQRRQLADGTRTDSSVPVQVETLTSGITSISSGHHHVCAITTADGAICWGDNGEGELGNGGAVYPGVADVTGFSSGVGEITSGSYFTLR
jgi:hypothetical protein